MIYWKYVDLDNWETICSKLNAWVDTTDFLQKQFFWNTVSVPQLFEAAPELKPALEKFGAKCVYGAIIVAKPHGGKHYDNIHVDDMFDVAARLQLPLRNTEGSYTYFYSARKDKIERKLLPNGHAFWWVDPKNAKEETRVCIDRPTIIRSGEPHAVCCNPDIKDFRITATLRLVPDAARWLT